MTGSSAAGEIERRYAAFAEHQARGASPLYEALARAFTVSDELIGFVARLPAHKQQPNLVLAAIRWCCGTPRDPLQLVQFVRDRGELIRSVILERSTQTNEPARCAVLLPVLASLPQPLALLEVGAAGGLCLLPDRYGYRYGGAAQLDPPGGDVTAPIFPCSTNDPTRIPTALPRVVWRLGIDLSPIDLHDPEQVRWLRTLVWPGQSEREERLQRAIAVARRDPPRVERGDLLRDLQRLAAGAPSGATLVVYHTAVLNYVRDEADRSRFARAVREIGAVWVANESPGVFPDIAEKLTTEPRRDRFLLAVDGEPVAETGFHGGSIDWL